MTEPKKPSLAKNILNALLRNRSTRSATQKFGGLFLRYFPGQITCGQFETFVIDYHENRLTDAQREIFERHMRFCPMCRTSFSSYLKTIEMGQIICRDDEKSAMLADAPRALIKAVLESSGDHAPRPNCS